MKMRRLVFIALMAAVAATPRHKLSLLNVPAARVALSAAYAVSATPSSGLLDGGSVVVSFSSSSPSASDLVLSYAPLPANVSSMAPVEWFLAAEADAAYLTTGVGRLTARLVHMRAAYTFALATGGLARPALRALSAPVTFANDNAPRGARLAATGVATEMRVAWSSASARLHPTVVLAAEGVVAPASSSLTWTAADLCGPPATTVGWREPGFVHSAVLTGLTPGRAYTYTVGDDRGRSPAYTFTQPSATSFPFAISVVGDMGSDSLDGSSVERAFPPAPNTTRLIAADIDAGRSHAVLHVGDLSYAMGYESSWDILLDLLSTANVIAPRVPYHVNQGSAFLYRAPRARFKASSPSRVVVVVVCARCLPPPPLSSLPRRPRGGLPQCLARRRARLGERQRQRRRVRRARGQPLSDAWRAR